MLDIGNPRRIPECSNIFGLAGSTVGVARGIRPEDCGGSGTADVAIILACWFLQRYVLDCSTILPVLLLVGLIGCFALKGFG